MEEALANQTDVVLRIDVQGAASVRVMMPEAISIFLVKTPLPLSHPTTETHTHANTAHSPRVCITQTVEHLPWPLFP